MIEVTNTENRVYDEVSGMCLHTEQHIICHRTEWLVELYQTYQSFMPPLHH